MKKMKMKFFAFLIVFLCLIFIARSSPHYDVHVIAHTHDDVGWLKTVDQYFTGSQQQIYFAGVQYIIDTVLKELEADPAKKFTYVEMAYFYRFWHEADNATKNQIRKFVNEGRLIFIGGGWVMNDEANTHLEGNTEQMTRGHEFILNEVGAKPEISWQLDPFGHAAEYAVLSAQMGFNGLYFARIDFQDYEQRKLDKSLEFIWRPSNTLGAQTEIFTHVMMHTTYCQPNEFEFEYGANPVIDDPTIFGYNVKEKADLFYFEIITRSQVYRTDQILFAFGCDFQYQNVMNFRNMDKLMGYINSHPELYNLTVFYSNPAIYTKAVYDKNISWPVKTDDIFPYRDNIYSAWTGYFTSRPALKGYVRTRENILYATNKLVSSSRTGNLYDYLPKIDLFKRCVGTAQHHDAIAGTEKQAVAYDYAERLSMGTSQAYSVWNGVLNELIGGQKLSFSFCEYLNDSICPAMDILQASNAIPVVLYNPIGFQRTEHARIPVSLTTGQNISIYDSKGKLVPSQLITNQDNKGSAYTVAFTATLPPMGFSTFFVYKSGSGYENEEFVPQGLESPFAAHFSEEREVLGDAVLENNYLSAVFSSTTGKLSSLYNKVSGVNVTVQEDIQWYIPSTGDSQSGQASGAYIFRPAQKETVVINPTPALTMISGPEVSEVRQYWSNWVYQSVRLYKDANYLEFFSNIGEIPINDGKGKEVIKRFTSNINSGELYYSDSEGAEMIYRRKDWRKYWNYTAVVPVTGNYVPVNEVGFINDTKSQLSLVNDRSRGFASIDSGEMEFMVHRRLLVDDGRGVGEPLNETEAIKTITNLILETPQKSARIYRERSLYLTHPVIYAFAPPTNNVQNWLSGRSPTFFGLQRELPKNLHMVTFMPLPQPNEYLFRLRHIYGAGEDSELSKPVTIDVQYLFSGFTVIAITETQLTGITPINQVNRYKWRTESTGKTDHPSIPLAGFSITLGPLEFRTFKVQVVPL